MATGAVDGPRGPQAARKTPDQGGPAINPATPTSATARPSARRRLAIALVAVVAALTILPTIPAPVQAATTTSVASEIATAINKERAGRGLTGYRTWTRLARVATDRVGRMAATNTLSHSAGGSISSQLNAADIQWYGYGEAIGFSSYPFGSEVAAHLVSMWMNSSPHRALLLSATYNYVGIGVYYKSSTRTTWAAVMFVDSVDHTPAIAQSGSTALKSTSIDFAWSGTDPVLQTRTAGLRSFDVQYRVDSGSWMTLRNDTTATSLTLANRARGHTYGFRVQAADRRGNLGAWTSEQRVWVP